MSDFDVMNGRAYAQLGNKVVSLVEESVEAGMRLDEALCVIIGACSDISTLSVSPVFTAKLAEIVRAGGPITRREGAVQ